MDAAMLSFLIRSLTLPCHFVMKSCLINIYIYTYARFIGKGQRRTVIMSLQKFQSSGVVFVLIIARTIQQQVLLISAEILTS